MSVPLVVGVSRRDVDVPTGTPMAGFAARTSPSTGVHDPLSVRSLVMGNVALVAVDCCVLHERTCNEVRARMVADEVVADAIIHATHTHSGPCVGLGRVGIDSPAMRAEVERAIEVAVRDAAANLESSEVVYTEVRGTGIARNRRHPERDIDPPIQVLGFEQKGTRRATLVTYPCHPVVLDASNTLISGDYVAPLRDRLEREHPGSDCVFFTGAAGDVNTGHSAESSYVAGVEGRTFASADRIGHALAEAVVGTPGIALEPGDVRFSSTTIAFEFEAVSDIEVSRQVDAWQQEIAAGTERHALLEAWLAWARKREAAPPSWTGRVSVLGIGSLRIVALPGEPFLAAVEFLSASCRGPLLVLGYCDGVPGYLPGESEYATGGYEISDAHRYYGMPAPFARGSLERATNVAAKLLAEMGE